MTEEIFGELLGGSTGNPAGYIAAAQDAGLGASESLESFRNAGGAIREQTWFRAWGQVAESQAARQEWQGEDLSLLPRDEMISPMSTRDASGYLYHLDVTVRDRATGAVGSKLFSLRTDDLISPNDAINTGIDEYTDYADDYGEQIVGAVFLNVFSMQPGV